MAHVVVASPQNLQQEIQIGRHRFFADESIEAGGNDTGPDPYGLLRSAMGARMGMTVVLHARRKGWPPTRTTVDLRHEKVHAKDCAECGAKEGKVDRIETRMELEGDLTDEQYTRLLEISERWPIKKTLTSEVLIAPK